MTAQSHVSDEWTGWVPQGTPRIVPNAPNDEGARRVPQDSSTVRRTGGTSEPPDMPGCFYICQPVGIGCAAAKVRNSCRVM